MIFITWSLFCVSVVCKRLAYILKCDQECMRTVHICFCPRHQKQTSALHSANSTTALQTSSSHERMRAVRATLPAASKEVEVLDALQRSLVLVISE